MSNIVEFLLARIAEDEAIAATAARSVNVANHDNRGASAGYQWSNMGGMVSGSNHEALWDNEGSETLEVTPDVAAHFAHHDPARVFAECEAKRRQIDHLIEFTEGDYAPWNETQLAMMASVYAGHPDYQADWATRPTN